MLLVLIVFGVAAGFELLLYVLQPLWQRVWYRDALSIWAILLQGYCIGALFAFNHPVLTLVVGILSVYRVVNLLRVLENRSHVHYMRTTTFRTSAVLMLLQALCFGLQAAVSYVLPDSALLYMILGVQCAVAAVTLASTMRRLARTRFIKNTEGLSSSQMPTVTVAIPARNETEELEACLQAVIASDYPKLEVLVLDDCSQTRRTPEIIRDFAHDGVRFIKGEEPRENWLAKNQAYEKLVEEASGKIIVFMGVDVQVAPESIRLLVANMVGRKKRMVSVMPLRAGTTSPAQSIIQATRYLWELTPPRRLFNRPPVLSSVWAIYRKDLMKFGGMDAVRRAITPEAYFAKQSLAKDGYSFLRANDALGITSIKRYDEQLESAVRARYPQLHRRPENVATITLTELWLLITPFVFVITGLLGNMPVAAVILSGISAFCFVAAYLLVVRKTRLLNLPLALLCFVPTVLADILLMHVSLYKYEFSEVFWKGRNICIPVMHIIPSLPKLEG